MGYLQFTTSLVLIALFSVAIISFAVNFGIDNNAAVSISDDPELTSLSGNTKSNLSSFREGSETTYQSIVESSTEGQTTPKGGQFALTPFTALSTTTNILKVGYVKIFGSGSGFGVFITAFISLLAFIFGMYLWKAWIGRNPD